MTTYVYYVNPGADAGGDGTADTLTGSTCAYQTLNAAITALAGSETGSGAGTSGDTIIYRCSGTSGNYEDSSAVGVTGHTTGVNVIIEGYNGNYTGRNLGDAYDASSCYNLSSASTALVVSDPNVTVRYLQVQNTWTANYQRVIEVSSGATGCVIDSCRCIRSATTTTGHGAHIALFASCIVKNCTTFTANINTYSNRLNAGIYVGPGATSTEIYNCSISGSIYGISTDGDVEGIFQNNAVWGSVSDWYDDDSIAFNGTGTFSYNASQDTPPYTNTANHVTMSSTLSDDWTDRTTGDLTVTDGSSTLADSGTSGGNIPTVDINGVSRSNYSIGAFEYESGAAGVTVTVPQANLSLSTFAPDVSVPVTAIEIDVGQASLTLSTTAPTVERTANRDITVAQANLALSTEAPDVETTANVAIDGVAGNLTLSTTAPDVERTDNRDITVAQADISLSTAAPNVLVTAAGTIVVDAANLTISAEAPTVEQTANRSITVGAANLTLSTTAPTASRNIGISPAAGSLLLSTLAPELTVAANQAITVDAAALALSTAAPTVDQTTNSVRLPGAASLSLSGFAPTIEQTGRDIWTDVSAASTSWTEITGASTTWTEI